MLVTAVAVVGCNNLARRLQFRSFRKFDSHIFVVPSSEQLVLSIPSRNTINTFLRVPPPQWEILDLYLINLYHVDNRKFSQNSLKLHREITKSCALQLCFNVLILSRYLKKLRPTFFPQPSQNKVFISEAFNSFNRGRCGRFLGGRFSWKCTAD